MLLSAKKYFWLFLVLCIILLALPIFIRMQVSDGLFIDSDSYRSLRLSEDIRDNGISSYDKLSYGGKPVVEEKGWYLLLSISPEFMARFLPFLFGVLSFIIFYYLISEIMPDLKGLSSLLLLVSPSFLYFFSAATKYTAAAFFILLGFYLFLKNRKNLSYASFLISGFFSIIGLFFVLLVFLYRYIRKKESSSFYIMFCGFIIIFLLQFYNIFILGLPEVLFGFERITLGGFLSFIIFGFGGKYGLGFFTLVLSLMGIYHYYKERYRFLFSYFVIFLFFIISFFIPFLLSYASFLLAFFAAVGLIPFIYGGWKSKLFRFLTLLVIFCGLLFSLLVFYDRVDNFEPNPEFFGAISFLKEQPTDYVVLSDYRNGPYITYADKKSFVDTDYLYAFDVIEKNNDMQILFNATNIDDALSIMNKYDVKYVIVDNRMKKEIFNNRNERLLFLLEYSPNIFVKAYSNDDVDVWYVRSAS